MFRKTKEKLKSEIKKDLLKEIDVSLKMEAEKPQNNNVVCNRPVVEHTKEELDDIRKSFLTIFIFSIFLFIALIIATCLNKLDINNKKETNDTNSNSTVEIDPIYGRLYQLADGNIHINNKEILKLINEITFNKHERRVYDSTYLFSADELNIGSIEPEYLLFLLFKTSIFSDYINKDRVLTKFELCAHDGVVKISSNDMYDLVLEKFNVKLSTDKDFVYAHYVDGLFSTYVKFVYSDGYYVSSCLTNSTNVNIYNVEPYIVNVSKFNDEIRIRFNVAFSNNDGLYADYGRNLLLVEGTNYDIFQYLPYASKYEFVYLLGANNNYYLSKVVKVNTTE